LKHGEHFQVLPELRKMIVFAPHNIVKDAPFTNIDLVTCRNLLIYLQPDAQTKALSLFHFGLRAGGFLFLGPSESTNVLHEEFETIDRHWKIFRKRRDVRLAATFRLPISTGLEKYKTFATRSPANKNLPEIHLLKAYDVLLDEYVPPSLLVDEHRKLLHSFAGAGHFLAVPDGRQRDDILDFIDPDLKMPLASALQRAAQRNTSVVFSGLHLPSLSEHEQLRLIVKPVFIHSTGDTYYLISFETERKRVAPLLSEDEVNFDEVSRERLLEVEEELRYTKENLQATVEEMETTNEELQATNEELVASNEELQSTNEELHSVNEELYTVNGEHQRKIVELTELTDDMDNLLRSTDIGTIFLDKDLNIRKFTPQISRVFQLVTQDVGRPLSAFTHNIRHESLLEDAQRVLEEQTTFEKEVRDRQGNWLLLRILPYRSKERIEGVVITLIDIGGLKLSEEKLRRLSKVYMDCADPIILEDLFGNIVDINPQAEKSYGWKKEELVGQNITVLVPPEEAETALTLRKRCRDHESLRNVETWRFNRAGQKLPILLTLSLLTGETGEPIGIATIAKDISAQKAAENEALQAVQRRDDFLAMLSHELRNPLGAMANAARLLMNPALAQDLALETAHVIHRQTRRMATLLDDLLDVSRVTHGKINLRRDVVDLTALVSEAIESVRSAVEARQQTLQIDLGSEPVWVEGDPARLLQIQENLLTNAIKYTPNHGHISISLQREGNLAIFTVRDNGIGIDAGMRDSIFELFVQGEKQLDRSNGGMGVGLSLVKMLVELHGGQVGVSSQGKDQGSEFRVSLPITTRPPREEQQTFPQLEAHGCRVIIVEDNDDSRNMLAELLRLEGCEVTVAADGLAGYHAIEETPADVALIDIGLPKMNGYELARKVKTELKNLNPTPRLIALTGYGSDADRQAVLNAGFDGHLVKPVTPMDLAQVLHKPQE
jgi:two-component system CheB/CheR fusion protein